MLLRKTLFALTLAGAVAMPVSAMANALTIINHTDQDSTSVMNNGACSDILGENGVTHPHTTNVVPDNLVTKACIFNKTNCKAEVHMTNNCSGPVVAIVILDIKQGIKSVQPSSTPEGYIVSGSGFTAVLDTGSALKDWFRFFMSNSK